MQKRWYSFYKICSKSFQLSKTYTSHSRAKVSNQKIFTNILSKSSAGKVYHIQNIMIFRGCFISLYKRLWREKICVSLISIKLKPFIEYNFGYEDEMSVGRPIGEFELNFKESSFVVRNFDCCTSLQKKAVTTWKFISNARMRANTPNL